MAMPWTRAKEKAAALLDGRDDPKQLTALFDACFRIQAEACEAAGRHIPLVVENVCGAQKWVGRARWHYGSFYLWGDVPALMPVTRGRLKLKGGDRNIGRANGSDQWDTGSDKTLERAGVKVATMGAGWYPPDHPKHVAGLAFNTHAETAIRRISEAHRSKSPEKGYGAVTSDGIKHGGDCFNEHGSKSNARKAASAHIAKIPLPLARWIARAWHPDTC